MLLTILVILHVGRAMCGHDGIVHGGLLATIFDESLARNVRSCRIALPLTLRLCSTSTPTLE
jgi:acyl-coenzyme A thioesterase PaaI-like protein